MENKKNVHTHLVSLSLHMLEAYMLLEVDEEQAASMFHAGLAGLRMAEDLSPELAAMDVPK
tara:strand:- start:1293 stop:1475 length:183 start_codon:yes stop_codon:yes gene_type:complete